MARTDSLREQHKKALEIVSAIQADLNPTKLAQDAQAISANLSKLSGTIGVHLAMEDKSLYPAMMGSANAEVKKAADKFSKEMGNIGAVFGAYTKKWNAGTIKSDPNAFITETKQIISVLGDRIKREEAELYPLADKLL